jgi:cardiolipin synthase (CMP-forming)
MPYVRGGFPEVGTISDSNVEFQTWPMTSATQLTVLRMILVPVFVLLILYQHLGWALAVFLLAGLTDLLDGLIARRYKQKTPLGTMLDPLADKLLLTSAFIVLTLDSIDLNFQIPLWLTVTVISRDLLLVLSVLIINLTIGRRLFSPSLLGKLTTACQLLLVMLVLIVNGVGIQIEGLWIVVYLTLALTVSSGMHYILRGMILIQKEGGMVQ